VSKAPLNPNQPTNQLEVCGKVEKKSDCVQLTMRHGQLQCTYMFVHCVFDISVNTLWSASGQCRSWWSPTTWRATY